ncbi:hypothetical protein [Mycobacterium shottsii]|uniref:hypothetical protein n=1 Tax=Mycobacterium shottsii TaxID=133549 RepID=UPI001C6563BB|nr:hypothetical protein [Mycobacterium shottsii]
MDESQIPVLVRNAKSTKFLVHNRLAATKPLNHLFALLGYEYEVDNESGDEEPEKQDAASGAMFLSAVLRPDVFGIRVGFRLEDSRYVLAAEGAVEYTWAKPVEYQRDELEKFLQFEAAARVTIATWAVLGELARSVGVSNHERMIISPSMVTAGVLAQFDAVQKSAAQ